jgi:hypothetical protein
MKVHPAMLMKTKEGEKGVNCQVPGVRLVAGLAGMNRAWLLGPPVVRRDRVLGSEPQARRQFDRPTLSRLIPRIKNEGASGDIHENKGR